MTPEISLLVDLRAVAKGQKAPRFSATPKQCQAVARRVDVLEVGDFKASFAVYKKPGGVYLVEGHIIANLVQACVRTLKPVPGLIDEKFQVSFMREPAFAERDLEEDQGEIEDIEIFGDEPVNLGELAIQYLSLAINPFPAGEIAPGDPGGRVAFHSEESFREKSSPFAALKKIRKNKEEG